VPESGTWYRAAALPFLPAALASAHSLTVRSRYSAGPLWSSHRRFAILYFTDSHNTALFEIGAMLGNAFRPGAAIPNPAIACAIVNVTVRLTQVADLTGSQAQSAIDTTAQELTGDWDSYQLRSALTPVKQPVGVAPTQELGEALFRSGIEGFVSLSARIPTQRVLIVFPDNRKTGFHLEYKDATGSPIVVPGA
jgi:hypothetical protein